MLAQTTTVETIVREIPADLETPTGLYLKLRGHGPSFLLESIEGGERIARYSFVGVAPRAEYILRANEAGIACAVHAIGDAACHVVLDACERAAAHRSTEARTGPPLRNRIEHVQLLHLDDIGRLARGGIIASMQPLHAPMRVDENDLWPFRVGMQRWPASFAWQTIRDAGATLVFGSDWPVVTQNPLRAVANCISRSPWAAGMPSHRQTLTDTLIS